MIVLYNAVLLLFCLPAFLFLALRYRKRSAEYFRGFPEKLGVWRLPPDDPAPLLWLHCASLGEVRAVEPLLRELAGYRVLVTTLTPAGYDYARQRKLSDSVYFAPLDFSFIVNRLFRRIRPAALVIVETELWPGLLHAARTCGTKTIIVNGRLSVKSYPYYRLLRPFWKAVLADVSCIAARAPEDARRFIELGVPPERVTVTGNIKYDHDFAVAAGARSESGFAETDLLWVCGSTREGEENVLLDVYGAVRERYPALKLILVPRHLNRVPALRRLLAQKQVKHGLRSEGARPPFDCLLVDTFGELQRFYGLADLAFVGGSLADKGGQNPIEPAAAGLPVLFGPHMENFLSEARLLGETGGGIQVRDAAELRERLEALCADREYRLRAGRQARAAVEKQKGAVARTARIVRGIAGPGR